MHLLSFGDGTTIEHHGSLCPMIINPRAVAARPTSSTSMLRESHWRPDKPSNALGWHRSRLACAASQGIARFRNASSCNRETSADMSHTAILEHYPLKLWTNRTGRVDLVVIASVRGKTGISARQRERDPPCREQHNVAFDSARAAARLRSC